MLDDHRDDDLGIIDGRPTDKPGVVLEVRRQILRIHPFLEACHLSGSGLSGYRERRQRASRSLVAVDHQLEAALDELEL